MCAMRPEPAPTNRTCFMHHETMTPAILSACTGITGFRCNWLMVGLGMGRIGAERTPLILSVDRLQNHSGSR
jgi:hypothetical protein